MAHNMIALGLYVVCISHVTPKIFGLVLGNGEGYREEVGLQRLNRRSIRTQAVPSTTVGSPIIDFKKQKSEIYFITRAKKVTL